MAALVGDSRGRGTEGGNREQGAEACKGGGGRKLGGKLHPSDLIRRRRCILLPASLSRHVVRSATFPLHPVVGPVSP